jgi:DNA topoisomerase-1
VCHGSVSRAGTTFALTKPQIKPPLRVAAAMTNSTRSRESHSPNASRMRRAASHRLARALASPQRVRKSAVFELPVDPLDSARMARLRYVGDDQSGIHRKKCGAGFAYFDAGGKPVRDKATLARIRRLVIPPAWTDVWISPFEDGHLQATGRDARGRKQYRYHARWRQVRDETKYSKMLQFAHALPKIRRQVEKDLKLSGLSRRKVLAAVVRLLEATLIRVGNDEYARTNHSFGLTTMRDKHVEVNGSQVRFQFRGKSAKWHTIKLADRRLARIVNHCQDLPGQELFQYLDDEGVKRDVTSQDVNDYLREIAGDEFTAKEFRTWAGTVLAAMALEEFEKFDSQAQRKRNIVRAIEQVAERLGNTPSVCRKCYIHPLVLDSYLDGTMLNTLKQRAQTEITQSLGQLRPEEAAVLGLLQQRLAKEVA